MTITLQKNELLLLAMQCMWRDYTPNYEIMKHYHHATWIKMQMLIKTLFDEIRVGLVEQYRSQQTKPNPVNIPSISPVAGK